MRLIRDHKEKINSDSGNKLNYYVGANLSAKADSFRELIKKILPNKKKEKYIIIQNSYSHSQHL